MNTIENYLTAYTDDVPERLPRFSDDVQMFIPEVLCDASGQLYGTYFGMLEAGEEPPELLKCVDGFGVPWVLDGNGPFPDSDVITIPDIEDWRNSDFTIPDIDAYDWDAGLEQDCAILDPEKVIELSLNGPYLQLINAMGVMGGLVAMSEEPEAVHDFLNAVTSYLEKAVEGVTQRVKCHIFTLYDDVASAKGPFISMDMFREMIKPYEKRLFDAARRGDDQIICQIHCCGHCEDFLDDFVEIGAQGWHSAQVMNDIAAVQKKYGPAFAIVGGWDSGMIYALPECSKELCDASVHECIDSFVLNGGSLVWNDGGPMAFTDKVLQRQAWANEEASRYYATKRAEIVSNRN